MQRRTKGIWALMVLSLGMIILGGSLGYADSTDYAISITEKLGRGVGNLLGSPLEIPCAIRDDISEQGGRWNRNRTFQGNRPFSPPGACGGR